MKTYDLHFFKSVKNSDLDDNGGILDISPILNNKKNNLLIDVTPDEVSQGLIRYRKLYFLPENELPLLRIYLSQTSTSQSQSLIHHGTDTDTQSDAEDYTLWKGSGLLHTALSAGDVTTIIVESENEGIGFNALDLIRIADEEHEEFLRIMAISWNGSLATLTCISDSLLSYDYSVGSYVSACIERGRIGISSLWLKEIIPAQIADCRNNINRIKFIF